MIVISVINTPCKLHISDVSFRFALGPEPRPHFRFPFSLATLVTSSPPSHDVIPATTRWRFWLYFHKKLWNPHHHHHHHTAVKILYTWLHFITQFQHVSGYLTAEEKFEASDLIFKWRHVEDKCLLHWIKVCIIALLCIIAGCEHIQINNQLHLNCRWSFAPCFLLMDPSFLPWQKLDHNFNLNTWLESWFSSVPFVQQF